MDVDGFVKLAANARDDATTQVAIAQKLANLPVDVIGKQMDNALKGEAVIKARLENVAAYLKIQWDRQAQRDLKLAINRARQRFRILDVELQRTEKHARNVGILLAGAGSWQAVRDGWIAFQYFQKPTLVLASAAIAALRPTAEAYDPAAWIVTGEKSPGPLTHHSLGLLLDWARVFSLIPASGTPAWDLLAGYLAAMNGAATAAAEKIDTRRAAAESAALELAKFDWDRLKR